MSGARRRKAGVWLLALVWAVIGIGLPVEQGLACASALAPPAPEPESGPEGGSSAAPAPASGPICRTPSHPGHLGQAGALHCGTCGATLPSERPLPPVATPALRGSPGASLRDVAGPPSLPWRPPP